MTRFYILLVAYFQKNIVISDTMNRLVLTNVIRHITKLNVIHSFYFCILLPVSIFLCQVFPGLSHDNDTHMWPQKMA